MGNRITTKGGGVTKPKRVRRVGHVQQKVMLLLMGGLALGLTHSPK